MPEPFTRVNNLENFMISKFPVHGTGCLCPYNFLDSQRPAVVFRARIIQPPAVTTISKCFQNTSCLFKKIKVKVRKRPDCTTTFRRAIAPADDITLRCNHSTSHLKWYVGAPQGIEIAPASEFREFRCLNPSPASIIWKISWFPNFRSMEPVACVRITFLIRNVQPWYFVHV